MKGGRSPMSKLAIAACAVALICFVYVLHLCGDANKRLKIAEERSEHLQEDFDSVNAQVQVLMEHKSKLERTLISEKNDHKRTQQQLELLEKQQTELKNRNTQLSGDLQRREAELLNQVEQLKKERDEFIQHISDLHEKCDTASEKRSVEAENITPKLTSNPRSKKSDSKAPVAAANSGVRKSSSKLQVETQPEALTKGDGTADTPVEPNDRDQSTEKANGDDANGGDKVGTGDAVKTAVNTSLPLNANPKSNVDDGADKSVASNAETNAGDKTDGDGDVTNTETEKESNPEEDTDTGADADADADTGNDVAKVADPEGDNDSAKNDVESKTLKKSSAADKGPENSERYDLDNNQ